MKPRSLWLANRLAAARKTHERRIGSQYSTHPPQERCVTRVQLWSRTRCPQSAACL